MPPETFHPIIRAWFTETYGAPTAVQAEAWPLVEQGQHVLALAPTGSGKTLTAFLSAISRFCPPPGSAAAPPQYPADKLTVLYVSPLKALNEDIKRNLLEPLAAIRRRFEAAGLDFPPVRVETRSGDTPQADRRRFLKHPPSILALTPESLAILLLNPQGRQTLSTVQYLILDEIHAVLGNKRGAFLSCQIGRLALIAGEFQRISLSATISAPETAAEFSGGPGRKVCVVAPPDKKQIDFNIEFSGQAEAPELVQKYGNRYAALISYILKRIDNGSVMLVFTGSRRRAERLCYFLNQEGAALIARNGGCLNGRPINGPAAFTHHGSLSKELRRNVEQRLAQGSLPCVVATASLELGIDIGSVDEVVLAGSPGSVSQTLQRIGRSGHSVGKTSRGRLFPFHGMDLLLAAALKEAVDDRDIETIRPIENPLDILAQMILALCTEKTRNIDSLFNMLKGFYIFRNLNRDSFDRTVRMLAGLGEKSRLREIKPRIWLDAASGEIGALDGSLLLLYASGGVIANRGLYSLRIAGGVKIGELDEEFVWERRLGDCFDFGGRGWRITAIGAEAVEAAPLDSLTDFVPFWKADTAFRSPNLTGRLLSLLDCYNTAGTVRPGTGGGISGSAIASLDAFLDSQRAAQNGIPLTGRDSITIEIIDGPEGRGDFYPVVIHAFRGGAVHYPFSLALAQELEETLKLRVESFSGDDAVLFLVPRPGIAENGPARIEDIFRRAFIALNASGGGGICRGERLFRNRLESSGIFGANFREAAERSLLLPKAGFGKRTPLWITRQRSRRLFDAVSTEDTFPVTAETWRSCLVDQFDMEGFRELLSAISSGIIALSFFRSHAASPFSRDMVRQETNALMYEYDERKDMSGLLPGGLPRTASLSDKVIQDALGSAALRPRLNTGLTNDFVSRLRREIAGWTPEDALSLREWVKERIAIPLDEWETLCAALPENVRNNIAADPGLHDRIKTVKRKNAVIESVIHLEWEEAWENEALTLLGPWLRYEGPVSVLRITEVFGVTAAEAEDALNALLEVEEIVRSVECEQAAEDAACDSGGCICDRENLDMLLRLSRKKSRPVIQERPAAMLIPFLALRQGVADTGAAPDLGLRGTAAAAFPKALAGFSAQAKLWETEFLPARFPSYHPRSIDREIGEGRLVWYGAGREKSGFCPPEDIDIVFAKPEKNSGLHTGGLAPLLAAGFFDRPRDFWEIKEAQSNGNPETGSRDCAKAIWEAVWQGQLSSDSFEAVRQGLELGFVRTDIDKMEQRPAAAAEPFIPGRHPRIPRALRDRWRGGVPVRGKWFSLALDEAADEITHNSGNDPIYGEYLNRDRVRLLLNRWGILCRPLLEHESPPLTWQLLLPAMRRMELSGELIAGRFFSGINSLQFASPAVVRDLERAETYQGIYWLNAADPASPAGLDIEGLDPRLCGRVSSSRLYFRGAGLIAVSKRNGKSLELFIDPGDCSLAVLLDQFKIPRSRAVLPGGKIIVEQINETEAARSEYAAAFQNAGFIPDRGKLCFW
ncbi:MAG: DEAD/DEAH box helicase [Treponema sp.]|jgi:ATP-dependent Lhr-like helicase|nr:DEAD/DEAH box helicase [Treponema sp.]